MAQYGRNRNVVGNSNRGNLSIGLTPQQPKNARNQARSPRESRMGITLTSSQQNNSRHPPGLLGPNSNPYTINQKSAASATPGNASTNIRTSPISAQRRQKFPQSFASPGNVAPQAGQGGTQGSSSKAYNPRPRRNNAGASAQPSSEVPTSKATAPPLKLIKTVANFSTIPGERRMPGNSIATPKENQDYYFTSVHEFLQKGIAVAGVFDGHGVNGKHVSNFVAKQMPMYIIEDYTKRRKTEGNMFDIRESIAFAVARTEAELGTTGVDINASGSTAIFTVRISNTLYVCNIGDSRCIVGRRNAYGAIEAAALSRDHKPDDRNEMDRITGMGGVVQPSQNQYGQFMGPARVWIPGRQDVGGLAIARTMGDMSYTAVGVTSTPEISVHEISPNDVFLVLGSDGIWDRLSNSEVTDIVSKSLPAQKLSVPNSDFSKQDCRKAAAVLTKTAQARWRSCRGGWYVDDITAMVWCL